MAVAALVVGDYQKDIRPWIRSIPRLRRGSLPIGCARDEYESCDGGRESRHAGMKDNLTVRWGLSRFVSTKTTLCHVPSFTSPSTTGIITEGLMKAGRR